MAAKKPTVWGKLKQLLHIGKKKEQPKVAKKELDAKITKGLEKWSNKKRRYTDEDRARWAAQLKDQLERYEMELALRELCRQTPEFAKFRKLRATDDKLPYDQKPISKMWGVALSKLSELQATGKVVTPERSPETSPEGSAAPPESAQVPQEAPPPPGALSLPPKEPATVVPPKEADQNAPKSASTSSSSSVEEMEKAGRLSDLIFDIVKDADMSQVSMAELSPEDYAKLSRTDHAKFDQHVLENTKDSLLCGQATVGEAKNWDSGKARPRPTVKPLGMSKEKMEIRKFCDCRKPSCPNNPKSQKDKVR